ncbi:MAG: hypothetical protein AUJ92_04910 [Armatimonadetes bacterium CG2_30_59_28]|nr:biotin transporter BioY [Armatimonadota bacterium]OIO96903.1 MAG: hypothetical protein AUJ92_04910 [Armatimonadetes bacterium CG2_30_59_28]PIU62118.1 MAG: biotin transporter BioY [Armatimonadetes bacterium CG07_land_8_20_14_0_80_59_28]PIX43719.1 MAG: biotin transporter BioY [Armatimonadetes bacterium CG_4_8_14_3_um_filter_58_9]PIY48940.1 MAG: biotin transporter BioY [Armatimonadetes bacterium CG_4_10_14_3_um_filter_59_10]
MQRGLTVRSQVIAEAAWPVTGVYREVALILLGSGLVALTARIQIHLWPVPVTGQTFGVLLVGALLGSRRGALAVLCYLAQGAVGLPFLAGSVGGIGRMLGPTGGYLLGFVPAAFMTGWLCEHGWDRRLPTALLSMLIGNACIYLMGLPWLANFVGWDRVLRVGVLPFIPGDLLKIALAANALPCGWALLQPSRR